MKNITLTLLVFLLLGCQTEIDMKEQQKEIIENYVHSYNKFDIEGMIRDFDENVVFENISNGSIDMRAEGLDAFKRQAESSKRYFTQRRQTIRSWQFDDSIVSIYIDNEATLDMDLPPNFKSGDTVRLQGSSRFRFKDGKIIKLIDEN